MASTSFLLCLINEGLDASGLIGGESGAFASEVRSQSCINRAAEKGINYMPQRLESGAGCRLRCAVDELMAFLAEPLGVALSLQNVKHASHGHVRGGIWNKGAHARHRRTAFAMEDVKDLSLATGKVNRVGHGNMNC